MISSLFSLGGLSSHSNWRTTSQSLLIIILLLLLLRREERKRAPQGKMLAFCRQKQFASTLDNMRQYSNTAQWMAADVTKPQVSKKNEQQTNLRAFWTGALTDKPLAASATPRKPQIESFATDLSGTFAAPWHDEGFIVVAMPWTGYWSFWHIDGRGSGLSLWVVLNNKLQRKCICVRGEGRKKK